MNALGQIRWVSRTLPAAALGPANPLPLFAHQQPIQPNADVKHRGLSAMERENLFDWGRDSILPYQVQDSYDRQRIPREMPLLEYSNGLLTALIAPQLGGRILQLRDERRQSDLVFCNPVFQPANLGALNAWFSGGIEWNGLIPGHSPFTCAPVFAGVVETTRGPILRLYEFDRVVEACWQLDLLMPAGDDRLFVHGRLHNPDPWKKQVYWWTNIAVPASAGMRVLSPADYSLEHVHAGNQLERRPFPDGTHFDGSFPDNWQNASSVFFRTERDVRPWIAAVDTRGAGVALLSSATMPGRKFFYFGAGAGGQHWMDFLSEKDKGAYIEIQSGLMPTQNQRFGLAAGADHHWTHALGAIQLEPEIAHQQDFQGAVSHAQARLEARADPQEFEAMDGFMREVAYWPLSHRLHEGSPWGDRHQKLVKQTFTGSMLFERTAAQATQNPWDSLVEEGHFGDPAHVPIPDSWALSRRWCDLLKKSAAAHGLSWLHAMALGIAAHDRGAYREAQGYYAQSLQTKPSWLGWRQMALLYPTTAEQKNAYFQALDMPGAPAALFAEMAAFLISRQDFQGAKAFLDSLTPSMRESEPLRIAQARVAAHAQDWAQLAVLLDFPFATIREGDSVLHNLWFALQKAAYTAHHQDSSKALSWQEWMAVHPLPRHLDFRLCSDPWAFANSHPGD